MKYLPPSEVPVLPTKKRSLNSQVMETPSPILYKRSRTDTEGVPGQNSSKRLKEDSEEKVGRGGREGVESGRGGRGE